MTSDPGHPDADDGAVGPVQAVITAAACRKVGPNETVTTTLRRLSGGATSSRPPGANSDCHGHVTDAWHKSDISEQPTGRILRLRVAIPGAGRP